MTIAILNRKLNELVIEVSDLKARLGIEDAPKKNLDADIQNICDVVAQAYRLPYTVLFSKTQRQPICEARMVAMYFIRHKLELSTPRIALLFEKKHDTALHAIRVVTNRYQTEKAFRVVFDDICRSLDVKNPMA